MTTTVEAPVAATDDLVQIRNASIEFGGRRVLHDVSLTIGRGEIHGLVGQNGSGKSTVTKVLAGVYQPTPETGVVVDGAEMPVPIVPRALLSHGVSFVHQDLGLIEEESVVENVAISRIPHTRVTRRILRARERADVATVLERLDAPLDLDAKVSTLSPAERTIVAIARAIFAQDGRSGLLVLDEATRSLPLTSLEVVHTIVRRVAASGGAVLMISHNLEEVLALTDRVSVLRDGRLVAAGLETSTLSEHDVAALMLGEAGDFVIEKTATLSEGLPIRVEGLSGGLVEDFTAELLPGTVVGITGLEGSGFEQVPYLLTGAQRPRGGLIHIDGRALRAKRLSVRASLRERFVLVPERRPVEGVAMDQSVQDNLVIPRLSDASSRWRVASRWEREESQRLVEEFDVRPPRPDLLVGQLSGGNQQKVLLAKWFSCEPRLVALHEPTQAVDVGARAEILRSIRRMAAAGAVVLISSLDANDLTAVCDRILVLRNGRITSDLPADTPHAIVEAVYGRGLSHDESDAK